MKYIGPYTALIIMLGLPLSCKKATPQIEEPELPTKITKINITYPSSKSLEIISGESERIKYELTPENATGDIEWESSDETVATVKKGRVNALTPGTVTITASCEDVSAKVKVTVLPIPVESITIPAKLDSYLGVTQKFPVEVTPKEAFYSVSWKCSSGVELSLEEGEFYLNATEGDKTCTVTFSADGVEDQVSVVTTYSKRMDIGMVSGRNFTPFEENASIEYDNLNSSSGGKVIYLSLYPVTAPDASRAKVSSSNESVVKASVGTVSNSSIATNCLRIELTEGTSKGVSDITVSYDDDVTGQVYTKSLQVSRSPVKFPSGASICFENGGKVSSEEIVQRGASLKLHVFDGSTAYKAKWSSSSTSIASVTANSADANGYGESATVNIRQVFGTSTIKAMDEAGNSLSFTVNAKATTMPDGTCIALKNSSSMDVSGAYSVRSTYDSRYSLSLCLTDKSGKKVSFPQGIWSYSGSGIELSRTTGDAVTVSIPYTKTAKTATISVKDDLKSITCKVSVLPARGFEGKLKCVVSDGSTYTEHSTVMVDFGKNAKIGIYNGSTLSSENYGITWEANAELKNIFTAGFGNNVVLATKNVAGTGTLTATSEQGEKASFTIKSGRSHLSGAQMTANNAALTQGSAIFSKSGSAKYVISQTTYFDVLNNYGTSKQEKLGGLTWTMSNTSVKNYYDAADKSQINTGRGCIHYFTATTASEMKCTVTATDDYGKSLSIRAEIRPWFTFSSKMALYYRTKNGTGSWSSWQKECDLGGSFNLTVRKVDRELEYKIATSSSGTPLNIPMTLTSWKSTSDTDYTVEIMEMPSAEGCNVKIHIQKRSYSFPSGYSKLTSPTGYPSFTLTFVDDEGTKYVSKATFIDKNQ